MSTITPIPPLDRTSPTYKADLEAMFGVRFPNLTVELVSYIAALSAMAAGGAFAIPYNISANPGTGVILAQNANQQTSTNWYVGESDSTGHSLTQVLNFMASGTSPLKSIVRLTKVADPTKWVIFAVLSQTAVGSGFRTFNVLPIDASSATPFAATDSVIMTFTTVGGLGPIGPAGTLTRRTTTVVSNTAPAPDIGTTDMYAITALAGAAVVGAPTSSGAAAADGAQLIFRIKDSGTARALSWNAIYRAGADIILPTTTVAGKTIYVGFIYNAADAKWDLMSTLGNI